MQTEQIISTHPDVQGKTTDSLIRCIEECYACAQTCISCADACLAEPNLEELRQCIRLNLDCADVCTATAALASRRTGSNESVLAFALELCALACRVCGAECDSHAEMHEHCRICAEQCDLCESACEAAIEDVGEGTTH